MFDPQPGQEIELDKKELLHYANRANAWDLKGYIKVLPPPDACVRIYKDKRTPDLIICEPQNVSFTVKDLSPLGFLSWKVSVGTDDFGVPLTWPSRYLFGKGVLWGQEWPGPSYPILVDFCEVEIGLSRRVHIHLVNQKKWTVTLPEYDVLVEQPSGTPNLYYVNTSGDVKKTSANMGVDPDKKDEGGNGIKLQVNQLIQRKEYKWQGFHRYTYEMNSSHFNSVAANPPGMNGKCRYKVKSWKNHPEIGLIECHNTDQFRWIYLPLRCLKDLTIHEKTTK